MLPSFSSLKPNVLPPKENMPVLVEEEPKVGDQYRFVVRSADEAVRILRERLGEKARGRFSAPGRGPGVSPVPACAKSWK